MSQCEACDEYERRVYEGKRTIMRLDPKPWRYEDKDYLRSCQAELKRLSASWQKHMHDTHQLELFGPEQ